MPAATKVTLMSSSRTEALSAICERASPTPEQFRTEILPGGQPMVLRAVARDWPLVIAASEDGHKAMSLLEAGANAQLASALRADPSEEGRFHYGKDTQSFNFIRGQGNVAGILAALREQESSYRPFAIAVQSLIAERYFPKFALSHPMLLVPPAAKPRLWIGNAAIVATHNDPIENVAVVAAGRRRFTLFPPSAEPDLYMGPHDPTPAGARISMVHVTAPDMDRFPRFARALEVAQTAELLPGDAIFIPRDWYHHVEALERFNVLVNYWWHGTSSEGEIDE
jgi:Cupin-like domain